MIKIEELISKFPKRPIDAHKGDFGHLFVIAGSAGYTGAPYLTAQAALLSGGGLVTLGVAKGLYPILAAKCTEVMVRPFFETRDHSLSLMAEKELAAFAENCSVLALGPGMSQNRETQILIRNLISRIERSLVIDADGINALVDNLTVLKKVKKEAVLTPHPGEFARLIKVDVSEVQKNRKDIALKFANEYNTVLVLKGSHTIVAKPNGEHYINETGNAGMASGGTGDVLTGIIAGFMAQGIEPFIAASLGVYFHGIAGDLALKEKGVLSLIATDLLNKLPEALKKLA